MLYFFTVDNFITFLQKFLQNDLLRLALVVIITLASYVLARKLIVETAHRISRRSPNRWDDYLSHFKVYDIAAYAIALLVLFYAANLVSSWSPIIIRIAEVGWVAVVVVFIDRLLSVGIAIYETHPIAKEHPIKGYVQILKLFVYAAGIIIGLATLLDRSPWVFLSGLGALSAVLLIIFRHTLLSFVASFQIVSQDLFRLGDWIEMPKFGADGEVIDIALHTVKVQNWDKTIVVIPTYKFLEESFKNWRGMELAGGRRIKRAVLVDQATVKLLDPPLLERLKKVHLLKDYLEQKIKEIDDYNREQGIDITASPLNGRRLTNLGTFRIYIEEYLKQHPKIRKDMTLMVRQLAPTPQGLPLEVYCFVADTRWIPYEKVQADIFDHILSTAGEFDLRVYQMPTGADLKEGLTSLMAQKY
ncbi:mechanosensitive ion channel family protein [Thermodesulfatator autotrophicus]|uniref:Mechanosensing system component YbdG n=1 Tax=Thermodesulfatator autotrophicus TaxID=1795632 RepID=A0A177E6Q8_9BACT|nr:mechanosensitive ion channel domain-containing protein [Thermodesulfatator autotrophicus]OAG27181.1 mechanosensitive ion channel protein MscS [Thermodesulfatator autotrophicus]